jgi:hypothetical protein
LAVAGDDVEPRQQVIKLLILLELHDHIDVQSQHDPLPEVFHEFVHLDIVYIDIQKLDFAVHVVPRIR